MMKTSGPSSEELLSLAKRVGDDWVDGQYYDDAEKGMEVQWDNIVWPMIEGSDFSSTVDLAAGHGRNTERLRRIAKTVIAVDINQTNIDFMRKRFAKENADNIKFMLTDGISLSGIADGSVTFLYCYDAMVHFDSDVVRSYIREFSRVLAPGGRGFVHYSNFTGNPTGSYREHPGWRNFMSRELFEHWLTKEGLNVRRSEYVWHGYAKIVPEKNDKTDAVTLFEKPLVATV